MPTLTLPRAVGSRAGASVVLTALAAAGASWVAAPNAMAAGENGDIRIHRADVWPASGGKDDPLVCRFYLDAVNFDVLTSVSYTITPQPPLPSAATVSGNIQLAGGAGHTDPLGLADGQYKISWTVPLAPGIPPTTPPTTKEKVFRVNCREAQHDGAQGPGGQIEDHQQQQQDNGAWGGHNDQQPPKGGVHAGGGGLIDTAAAYSPVAGAAAVGLIAVCGVVYFRLIRRRPHGAA
ncbi:MULTISPECIES: hypothetical protein [unclassified Streptomyces]|uniref:hypothetical protein n=1 Tax=unclassified Streptomyces TaxID=2593676 RepID=UPI00089BCE1B|nr:hypothetical protein [Streptomyces sp. 2231.1]SEC67581.1 hypothetical protein SAMN05216532_2076 [Streptomyces sp. 2231.1]